MEQTSIIKGEHAYPIILKHLDKFIHKYILCKGCKYPELRRFAEGKNLKSQCNSCGSVGEHDALHKAGKEILKSIKENKDKIATDI